MYSQNSVTGLRVDRLGWNILGYGIFENMSMPNIIKICIHGFQFYLIIYIHIFFSLLYSTLKVVNYKMVSLW